MTALRLVPVRDDDPPPDSLVEACKAILLAPYTDFSPITQTNGPVGSPDQEAPPEPSTTKETN